MVTPLEGVRSEIDGEPLADDDLADSFQWAMPDGVDEQRVLDALYRDLHRGEMAKAVLAEAAAERAAKFYRGIEHRPMDGMGQVALRMPLDAYLYWEAREGPEFWSQQSNIDYMARLNPGLVPETRFKPQVVVDRKVPARGAGNPKSQPHKSQTSSRGGRWRT